MNAAAAVDRVRSVFEANFARGAEIGASVAVWQDNAQALCFCHGWRDPGKTLPWTPETLVLVWSATKGLASACLLHAVDLANLDLSTEVARLWPGFAANGKGAITIGQVASHRAGLAAIDDKTPTLLDHDAVVAALEAQAPLWSDEGHGYGPRTYGFLADEIVRRLTGKPLGVYWRENFGDPMDLDLWIGLPEPHHPRVAQMLAPRAGSAEMEAEFSQAMTTPGSLTRAAFSAPGGPLGASAMNSPVIRSASIPSLGGIGSASALARFYGMLAAGGQWAGETIVSPRVLGWMSTALVQGMDKTLRTETAFSAGYMKDPLNEQGEKKRRVFGPSLSAFGHPGAGGSLGFADPQNRLGFAYVMNQMEPGVLPKSRAIRLVDALYEGA